MAAGLETLAHGFGLIEGPRVDEHDNLYFSDVPNGGVRRRDPSGEIAVVVPKRRGVGGIAIHADGGLVVSGRNICHVKDGETRVLFDPGAPGFNDLMTDADGRVYCGTIRSDPFDESGPRTPGEAYLIDLDGSVTELYGDVSLTNGIGFSPDGRTMYHSDSGRGHVICHDVETGDDGAIWMVNRRAIAHGTGLQPDGLAVDSEGVIWVADFGKGAVIGLSPEGETVGRIDVPSTMATSLCFGGSDLRDLYIVTANNTEDEARAGTIFRTRVDVPGLRAPEARV